MHTQRINITLPNDLLYNLRRSVPVRSRSKFIANALKEKLPKRNLRRELAQSLKINKEFYQKVGKEIQEDFKYADAEVWEKLS